MAIDLTYFLLALGLLLFPRSWMRVGSIVIKRRRNSSVARARKAEPWNNRSPGDPRVSAGREFGRFRNYLDLARAAAGSVLLTGELGVQAVLAAAPAAPRVTIWSVMGLRALLLIGAVLAQTLRWEHGRVTFYPPVFFLAGLSVALCGPWAALFAFILIWTVSAALPNAQAFLTLYAVLLVVFGHVLSGIRDISSDFAGVLCFLPVLLSLLSKKPLIVLSRKGTHGAAG